jgi:hypothetical protein
MIATSTALKTAASCNFAKRERLFLDTASCQSPPSMSRYLTPPQKRSNFFKDSEMPAKFGLQKPSTTEVGNACSSMNRKGAVQFVNGVAKRTAFALAKFIPDYGAVHPSSASLPIRSAGQNWGLTGCISFIVAGPKR